MSLFNLRKMFQPNQPIEDKDEQPYTCLTMDQGHNDTPSIDDVFRALELLQEGRTDFVTVAHFNQELDIEAVQAIGEMGMFTIEALPPENSPDQGKIYYKDHLDEYSLQYYFQDFFERQKVAGLENFEVKKM